MTPADLIRRHAAILRAVPASAARVLDVGGGPHGPAAALRAAGREVVTAGPDALPTDGGPFDCVLLPGTLGHAPDPHALLGRCRGLVAPGGAVVASVPNAQHHSVVAGLLRGEFPDARPGLAARTPVRFFTYATLLKLFLDAGLAPDLVPATPAELPPAALLDALGPALTALGLHPRRTAGYLAADALVCRASPLPDAPPGPAPPVTVVCCASDDAVLAANLLASPDLGPGSPHEALVYRGCRSAAEGLNAGLAKARHGWAVCAHQDVYLPLGWVGRFLGAVAAAEGRFGRVGVAGVYGVACGGGSFARAGHVVDRDRRLCEGVPLPASVGSLDEAVLAVRPGGPVRFDPALGWHFYGTDACLAAEGAGLLAVAVDAVCLHNSRSVGLPADFAASGAAFAAKWADRLPLATSCVRIDRDGRMAEW